MTNKVCGVALLAVSLVGGAMGQTKGNEKKPVQQQPAVTIPLSTGTAINASLVGSIDSERSKPGDPVNAVITEPVVYQRSVLIPKGSRIIGHVVRTGSGGEQTSALMVEFDQVILKNGETAQLNAGIQALAPVGAQATIVSREKYEEDRLDGALRTDPGFPTSQSSETLVVPSTYTVPRRTEALPDLPGQALEGGLDRRGRFTPDSKGAFSEPNLQVFTPVSEGSHGTVLVGAKRNIHLENGMHLLIVVQPPTSSAASPSPDNR
jgi:hypothetical protein